MDYPTGCYLAPNITACNAGFKTRICGQKHVLVQELLLEVSSHTTVLVPGENTALAVCLSPPIIIQPLTTCMAIQVVNRSPNTFIGSKKVCRDGIPELNSLFILPIPVITFSTHRIGDSLSNVHNTDSLLANLPNINIAILFRLFGIIRINS